jgi:drug/metabolite transporter (DMT)-like permease
VLSVDGANFVRYLYGAPLALSALAFLVFGTGRQIPTITLAFLGLVAIAGIAQIVATSLMIHAFSLRNYAVGTVYSKTETVWVALFATYISHEPLHLLAWMGILVCLGGVAILSVRGSFANIRDVLADLTHKGALYGMLSGAIFAVAAGTIREASKLLTEGDFWIRGITVLACMNTIQIVLMGLYLARRDRPQLGKVWVNWRSSIWVGIFSVLGSAGWALAMTLENAALVRAVGQIELVFTFIASHVVLKERPSGGEWIGSVLVVGGVVLILIFR